MANKCDVKILFAGVSYVTFSADGTPMEYEEPSGANVIAIAEESVVETVEIPLED